MYDWINENHVKTLNKITHVHFDFMTPKCHKITPRDKKKRVCERERERELQEKEDKRMEEKKKTESIPFSFTCISSPLLEQNRISSTLFSQNTQTNIIIYRRAV